jgi:hypothetical protein
MMVVYFVRLEKYVQAATCPTAGRVPRCGAPLLRIGVPSGGEFFLMFVYMGVLYWLIRPFGARPRPVSASACG